MWLHILLLGLTFNGAFLFPDYLGFLILIYPILLVITLKKLLSPWSGFVAGWWCGICIFGMHFTWLLELLIKQSQSPRWFCGIIYAVVVVYFALSSACWFGGMAMLFSCKGFNRTAVVIVTSSMYWIGIENWIFLPIGLGTGYPFLNPCIPLGGYTIFLKTIGLVSMLWSGSLDKSHYSPVNIAYVAPVVNRVKNTTAAWKANPETIGYKIHYHLYKHDQAEGSLYVSPETTFPFPLNHYPQISSLWTSVLEQKDHFFVGSILQEEKRLYQAIFWLQRGPIIKVYVKKMLMPFVEKIPRAYQNFPMLKNMFLKHGVEFCEVTESCGTEFFDVHQNLRILPQICLEFFFAARKYFQDYKDGSKNVMIFFFANDSWFNNFFREILRRAVTIKANFIGLPVVYIGHFGYEVIEPQKAILF